MFLSEIDVNIPYLSEEEMREVDRVAVEDFNLSILQMMENVGRNLTSFTIQQMQNNDLSKVLIFSGSGGNGGGGLCAARHLLNHGIDINFILSKDKESLTNAARAQYHILEKAGHTSISKEFLPQAILEADVIIDALIGYSLKGDPKGISKVFIDMINRSGKHVISLDIPSGIDASSGEERKPFVNADQTLTLALPKFGLSNPNTGDLYLADIGIPHAVYSKIGIEIGNIFGDNYIIPIKRNG